MRWRGERQSTNIEDRRGLSDELVAPACTARLQRPNSTDVVGG
jgi:hypothetical protein